MTQPMDWEARLTALVARIQQWFDIEETGEWAGWQADSVLSVVADELAALLAEGRAEREKSQHVKV